MVQKGKEIEKVVTSLCYLIMLLKVNSVRYIVSLAFLEVLFNRVVDLLQMKGRRDKMQQQAESLRSHISTVWDRLHIPDLEREAVNAKTSSITQQTLQAVGPHSVLYFLELPLERSGSESSLILIILV